MKNLRESSEELTLTSQKWVSDDDTISNYGHYGAILGAALGFGMVLSSDLHCRIIQNSQGCGIKSVSQALFFYGLMIVLIGVLALFAGRDIGRQHPSFRRLTTLFYASFFFSQFVWSEILTWLRPALVGTFWDKRFGDYMLIGLMVFYAAAMWLIKRKSATKQLNF